MVCYIGPVASVMKHITRGLPAHMNFSFQDPSHPQTDFTSSYLVFRWKKQRDEVNHVVNLKMSLVILFL